MNGQLIGPYRVLREIGQGGMGSVFEAVHQQIQRRVAIKVLRSEYGKNQTLVQRFFNEARAVNIVNHPSVVQISEFGQLPDGLAYIVMEYLDGESLGSRMKRQNGKLTIAETLRLTRQIAAALAAAHAKGIIHRDLKPETVTGAGRDGETAGGGRAERFTHERRRAGVSGPIRPPGERQAAMTHRVIKADFRALLMRQDKPSNAPLQTR